MRRNIVTAFAMAGALAAPALADSPIVVDGRPAAMILVGDADSPVAYEAAHEIARLIEKATGACLLVYPERDMLIRDPSYPSDLATKIVVGDGAIARKLGLDVKQLPAEGYAIKTTGRYIVLAGRDGPHTDFKWRAQRTPRRTRGTWHAACDFLEDVVGVRWLWPGELGEAVPRTDHLSAPAIDRTDAPRLKMRAMRASKFYGADMHRTSAAMGLSPTEQFAMSQEMDRWVDHQRMGSSFSINHTEFTNRRWLKPFGKLHPEWFALQPNGQRLLVANDYRVRMCLSNPGVIDQVVRQWAEYLDQHPDIDGYGLGPSDIYASYCSCDNCKAWGPTISDLVARHVAAVAEKAGKLRPGKFVHGLAYHDYNAAPKSKLTLPDNVVYQYVGFKAFGYFCQPVRQRSLDEWYGWAKVVKQLIWRPNNFAWEPAVPSVYVTKLGEDYRRFYKTGLVGVDLDHLKPHWALSGLNQYVAAKLSWDPRADVPAIVADYCEKGFGPASKQLRAYFDRVEGICNSIADERPSDRDFREIAWYYTLEDLAALRGTLDQAKADASGDPIVGRRVSFLLEGLDFADIESAIMRAIRAAKKTRPSAEQVDGYRKLIDRRQALLKERRASFAVDATYYTRFGKIWAEKLFVTGKPGVFDDLPNAYHEIVTLPEQWRFKIDPDKVGQEQKWYAVDRDESDFKPIRVGEFWEEQGYPNYNGVGWYRLRVKLPADLAGKPVQLCFGAADENAAVYVNGQHAGTYDVGPDGWDKRFFIDVTKQIRPGKENLIAVRVADTVGAGGLWRPVKVVVPKRVLAPVRDTYFNSVHPNTAFGKNPSLAVGATGCLRTIITWQLPARPDKPAVRSARLVLSMRYSTGPGSYAVYDFDEQWYEPKASWRTSDGATTWPGGGGAGGKGEPAARFELGKIEANESDEATDPSTVPVDVTELVRSWSVGGGNCGVLIVQTPRADASMAPYSREAKDPRRRPRLEIDYAVANGP